MKYFPKDRYFLGEETTLESQKRKLAMKYHPDRWWKASDFVAMMEEYSKLKSNLSVRQQPKQSETFRYERPQREEETTLDATVFLWFVDAIRKTDEILEMIPANVRGFVLFITAMVSLSSGLEILYATLVIATLLKKHWFAFFALFMVPVKFFGEIGTTPEWFQLFSNGFFIFPLLAVFFIPWFVEPDERTEEERKEALNRSFRKVAEWL